MAYALVAVTLLAFALRLYRLDFQSLWWDEGISLYLAGRHWLDLTVNKDFAIDLHPPLYHLALSWWGTIVGSSTFASRLLSVYSGFLAIPLVYQLARRMVNPSTGLIAALLLTVSPFHIFYSQEARMYPMMATLALASLVSFTYLIEGHHKSGWAWLGYVLSTTAGLYTFYYVGLLWIAQNISFGLRRAVPAKPWAVAQVAVVLLYAPWLAMLFRLLTGTDYWRVAQPAGATQDLWGYLKTTWLAFTTGFAYLEPWTPLAAAIFAAIATLGLASARWRLGVYRWQVVLWFAIPLALAYAISLWRPFYFPRFLLYDAAILLAPLASGFLLFRRRWMPVAIALGAIIVVSTAISLRSHYTTYRTAFSPSDYLVVLDEMQRWAQPGDLVIASQAWQAGYIRGYLPELPLALEVVRSDWLDSPKKMDEDLKSLVQDKKRVWILSWSGGGPWQPNPVENILVATGRPLYTDQYSDTRIRLKGLSPSGETIPLSSGPKETLGDSVALVSYGLFTATRGAMPNDTVGLALSWQALKPLESSYTIFVHVLTNDDKIVAQSDGLPLGGTHPTTDWAVGEVVVDRYLLPRDALAEAGRKVAVGMYDAATGRRLGVPGADQIILEELELAKK